MGIGIFNAITEKTSAKIRNIQTGQTRKEVIEPLANYNILVVDQQFNKNSSVSLINTSVLREGGFRDANVTAALFDITDKANKWNVDGSFKLSNKSMPDENIAGFSSSLEIEKVSGNYRYGIENNIADKKYDINDLGILFRNNYNNFRAFGSYRIFEPTEKLNNFNIFTYFNYETLFEPSTYTGNGTGISVYAQNKKNWDMGGNINARIGKQYDYFEPREDGRFFVFQNTLNTNMWFNTNYAKKFALFGHLGAVTMFDPDRDLFEFWTGVQPRMRFNDKFSISYEIFYQDGNGSRGYVTKVDDDIIFGERAQTTVTNSIGGSYNFNSFHSLELNFRNYWATVTYDNDLFILQKDGSLSQEGTYTVADVNDPNVNFNTWNLDFRYSWQFAPGSQLTALYRNSLFNFSSASRDTYFESLESLFKQPIEHIFSLRLVYYIDYNTIKSLLRKNS